MIVGAGFGGLACAQALGGKPVNVTIVDRRNYHLFVPLLYQVATAALSPADIARPIRRILSRYKNIEVVLGTVTGVDTAAKRVRLPNGTELPYDKLVVAAGSDYSYFGHPEWAEFAPGPRSLEDARRIRAHLLIAFERAEASRDPAQQNVLMTTVIVGGGPTGVEMAGSVAELARYALARDFRTIDPRRAKIVLIEAGPRILLGLPGKALGLRQDGAGKTRRHRRHREAVESIDAKGVVVAGRRIDAGTVIWGAGIKASPAAGMLGVPLDRAGRVPLDADLSVKGVADVYASRGYGERARRARRRRCRHWRRSRRSKAPMSAARLSGHLEGQEAAAAVQIPQPRQHRDRRPSRGGVRFRLDAVQGPLRVADVGTHPRLPAGRVRQPPARLTAMAVGLHHLRARRAA